jgi:hypothetical protein
MDPTGTIGGWKTAIFYDGQGRPYWRSDGLPLDAPNFEDLTIPEEEKQAWLKAHPEVKSIRT